MIFLQKPLVFILFSDMLTSFHTWKMFRWRASLWLQQVFAPGRYRSLDRIHIRETARKRRQTIRQIECQKIDISEKTSEHMAMGQKENPQAGPQVLGTCFLLPNSAFWWYLTHSLSERLPKEVVKISCRWCGSPKVVAAFCMCKRWNSPQDNVRHTCWRKCSSKWLWVKKKKTKTRTHSFWGLHLVGFFSKLFFCLANSAVKIWPTWPWPVENLPERPRTPSKRRNTGRPFL